MTPAPGNFPPGARLAPAPSAFSAPGGGTSLAAEWLADPQLARVALGVVAVAVAEEAQRRQHEAQAWVAHYSPRRAESSLAWNQYRRQVELALTDSSFDVAALRRLLAAAPANGGEALAEFNSLLAETDAELFAEAALNLAERNLRQDRAPAFARELLRLAAGHPALRARALARLEVLNGGGGFGAQFEYQAPRLLRELGSPVMLVSFGSGMLASRAASLAVLSRSLRFGWGTLLVSEGAALAVEVPAFTLTRRLGTQLFSGGEGVFDPEALRRDLLSGFTSFGLLRAGGNFLQLSAPAIRRWGGLNAANGEFSPFGRFTFEALRFGTEFAALSGAHSLNVSLGLETALPNSNPWVQGLLSVGHLRLAGRAMEGLGLNFLPGAVEARRAQLLANGARELLQLAHLRPEHPLHDRVWNEIHDALREGRMSPFALEDWIVGAQQGRGSRLARAMEGRGLPLLASRFRTAHDEGTPPFLDAFGSFSPWAFAWAGRSAGRREPRPIDVLAMSMEGDGQGGDSNRPSKPEGPPTRRAAVFELLRKNLEEYSQSAEHRDTVLGKAAKRLQELLDRSNERPDLEHDEEFTRALEEVEAELREARAHETAIQRSVATLKVLFRRSAASGQEIKPEVAEQQSAQIEQDEAQRSAFASSLARMREILQRAKTSGWSEGLYRQLEGAKDSLNDFYGKAVWRIPGLNRLLGRNAAALELLDRRQGAALALVLPPISGRPESPVRRRLLALDSQAAATHDLDLELLHEGILLAARNPTEPVEVYKSVQKLAEEYRASDETAATMALTAETVSFLIRHATRGPDLLEHLDSQVDSLHLHDRLVLMQALRDPNCDSRLAIEKLSGGATASDYFSSALLVYFRAEGDATKLGELLHTAGNSRAPGFQPSLAVSFFGAAHGRKALPASLVPPPGTAEAVLIRAFPKETK
ncbi:MAG: hypothetical protein U1F66_10295 [bacterium]